MCRDYYTLEFMDRSVDTSPIAPALAAFFDNVLDRSVSQLNFKVHKLTYTCGEQRMQLGCSSMCLLVSECVNVMTVSYWPLEN